MRKSRVLLMAVLSIALLAPNFASADNKPIEQFWDQGPAVKNVGGYTGVLVEDAFELTARQSNMVGFYFEKKNGNWVQKEAFVCKSYADPNCANADNIWYDAILEPCTSSAQTNCIATVTAIKDGKEIAGKFAESYPAKNEYNFIGNAALNIPDGGLPSLWTFDGLTHQGGDKFMVYPRYFLGGAGRGDDKITNFAPQKFDVGIFAITKEKNPAGTDYPTFSIRAGKADAVGKAAWWDGTNYGCQASGDKGECAMSWPLPKDVRFRLEIRTSIPLTSFMHGRLLDPTIKISTESDGRQLFTIEAGSVSVPVVNTWVKNSEMPKALYDYLYAMPNWGGVFVYTDGKGSSRDNVQLLQHFDQYNAETFKEYLWWLDVAKDKSIGDRTMWIARTLSSSEIYSAGDQIRSCLSNSKELTGIVTTNAGMYISSPPTFNKESQSLDYKVSSPHLNEAGKPNVGNYYLILNSDAARCIYGFTKAPISATVSIVSSDGSSQVATTAVSERNGWLYLSANGFNYSSPTVRVKLTQEAPAPTPTPTPTPTPEPTPTVTATPTPTPTVTTAPVKKTTISCIKGKVVKKVTAVKPVCPKGYKKK